MHPTSVGSREYSRMVSLFLDILLQARIASAIFFLCSPFLELVFNFIQMQNNAMFCENIF